MSILRRAFERREASFIDPSAIPSNGSVFPLTWAGVSVTERTALQHLAVWACATIISDSISMLPVTAFEERGAARGLVATQPRFFDEPHAEVDNWPEWIGMELASILLRGNAYARIVERDAKGFATQAMPLHPDEVSVRRNTQTGRVEYKVAGESQPLTRFEMLHVPGFKLAGAHSVTGLSPIEYARQAIGLGLATEEYGGRYFGDSANPSGVLETDQDMDEHKAQRLNAQWMKAHGSRHRYPAVLANGLKWKPILIAPNESQFLETREFNALQIAMMFRVPPHMLGMTTKATSWGSGIEEMSLGYVTYTLQPWITRFEKKLSKLLPAGQYVKFNVGALLRGRQKDRYEGYKLAIEAGLMSPDEVRALEEMGPLPEGKGAGYIQPSNMSPAGDNSLQLKQRIDAAGSLVRGGWDPNEALALVGLDPIKHTGLIPVTVRPEEELVRLVPAGE